jgi:hypothetical protein
MLKIKYIGLFTILLIGFNSCKLLNTPSKTPKKISIEWRKNGGMLPSYSKLHISTDSCVWENYNEVNLHRTVFSLSEHEVQELYSILYLNHFNKITYSKQEVLDRGGSDIFINIDGNKYELLNSGSNFIEDQFINNFKTIEKAILQKYEDINNKQNTKIIIDLDQSITNSKDNVVLYINNKEVYNEQKTGEFNSLHHSIHNNSIQFKILIMQKYTSSFQTVLHKYELTLNESPTHKDIILTLVDGNLTLK